MFILAPAGSLPCACPTRPACGAAGSPSAGRPFTRRPWRRPPDH